jgi:apolipoprotein D and lipocalin family protein
MKFLFPVLFVALFSADSNVPVSKFDLRKYAGTWYSLYSIPTVFDKGSRETTTKYTLNKAGFYDVVTTYKKSKDEDLHAVTSKIFPNDEIPLAKMKCQFIWPIKVDYWVIELADDYSYVVVGHPDHKFLFIMSRNPVMPKKLLDDIILRCSDKGYDVSQLTSQMHGK